MTPSELKASNDQLRNWNADYRRQIAGLESRNASGIEHVAELETIIIIKRGRIKELKAEVLHENDLFIAWRSRAEGYQTLIGELEARLDAILDAPIDQDHNGNDILVRDYHEVREIVLKALEKIE
jgi:hypothetical protein